MHISLKLKNILVSQPYFYCSTQQQHKIHVSFLKFKEGDLLARLIFCFYDFTGIFS